MKNYRLLTLIPALTSIAILFVSCTQTTTTSQSEENKVLTNISKNVILAIYSDVNTQAQDLLAKVQMLCSSRSQANFDAAKTSWITARKPFEMAEAFEYGPLEFNDLQKKLDFHPFSESEFDSLMASSVPLTADYIATLPYDVRGFHAIEYVLWGETAWNGGAVKTFADITPRECEYLVAVATDFALQAKNLYEAWAPEHGNYVVHFTNPNSSDSVYKNEKAALQEIMDGLVTRSQELGDELLSGPYHSHDPRQQESLYSNNSNNDFSDITKGMQSVYTGSYGTSSGEGLSHLVSAKDPVLDASVRQQLTDCITKINAMTPDFTTIVKNSDPRGQVSIDAVQHLTRALKDSVKVVLNLN
jgi:putative iron-regulated protein